MTASPDLDGAPVSTPDERPAVDDGLIHLLPWEPADASIDPADSSPAPRRPRGSRFWTSTAIAAVGLAAAVCTGLALTGGSSRTTTSSSAPPSVANRAVTTIPGTPSRGTNSTVKGRIPPLPRPEGPAHSAPAVRQAVVPVEITIPSIGVDSGLEALGLDQNGELAKPSQWGVAGWYADGVRPGDTGPAVIAGHVDSVSGPAVFYRLRDLHRGAVVLVREADGRTLRFVVDNSATYPKDRFPSSAIYGPAAVPVLRLVTCTGDFDFQAKSYLDNLVVTAYLG